MEIRGATTGCPLLVGKTSRASWKK